MSGSSAISVADRVVSLLSYITAGWVGLIYLVIMYFRKKNPSVFLRYNVFQSIFISFFYFVLCMTLGFIANLLLAIPFINTIVSWFILIFNRPIVLEFSIIQIFMIGLFLYMSVFAFIGRYPRVYWVSKIIDHSVR